MTTTINISLDVPHDYGIAKLTRQLTEYAQRLVAEETSLHEADRIVLSEKMISAAKMAEQQYEEGQCVGVDGFNQRFAKWL